VAVAVVQQVQQAALAVLVGEVTGVETVVVDKTAESILVVAEVQVDLMLHLVFQEDQAALAL
jgi:hypothetical protein